VPSSPAARVPSLKVAPGLTEFTRIFRGAVHITWNRHGTTTDGGDRRHRGLRAVPICCVIHHDCRS
jgi:hypothetical protein